MNADWYARIEARLAAIEHRHAQKDAERAEKAERELRQELRESFRAGRDPLDPRNADPDDHDRWIREVDSATRRRAA